MTFSALHDKPDRNGALWTVLRAPDERDTQHLLKGLLGIIGVIWALIRLREARKLNLTVSEYIRGEHNVLYSVEGASLDVALGLTGLETLVQSFLCTACMA